MSDRPIMCARCEMLYGRPVCKNCIEANKRKG
ncbi:CxxC motif protein [Haloarcula virus Hardyhisp2]|uniref:CxxC motif protein n=1 Tax=Haloarcula virus Hardyhisp2 TaxID=2811386 RepID=A0A898KBJ9_9VIRU|nr:CxxC motif protein [Haloarcula virus Hardyhisp2]QSJ05024.1 CxxC motif protein [Haloarcula virus Hardyhisp2]